MEETYQSQFTEVPLEIYRHFGLDILSTKGKELDKLKDISKWTFNNSDTIGDNLMRLKSLQLRLGQPRVGEWQDCLNYAEVHVGVCADQNSATNGLVIEWSSDGATVCDNDVFSVYANADTTVNAANRLLGGVIGAKQTGGTRTREREIILKQNSTYCLRIIANTAGFVDYLFEWYEHTNK